MFREFMLRHFGIGKKNYEYWVYTKEIKLPYYLKNSYIGDEKFKRKNQFYDRTGQFESPIIIDKDFNLVDGFSSFKIAKLRRLDKIPVYFK